jgi:hypothetical protein
MHKDIILLAASKKHKNYCVAGIDKESGGWVRIVSDDPYIDFAVNENNMKYIDGNHPELLDIIRFKLKSFTPNYYQPENCLFDSSFCWEKIGKAIPKDIFDLIALNKDKFIFYNNDRRLECDFIEKLSDDEKHSLTAVLVKNPIVVVQEWTDRKTVRMNFRYKECNYNKIAVTDPSFIREYINNPEGRYSLKKQVMLIISLGENFEGYHYKLIAGVIDL